MTMGNVVRIILAAMGLMIFLRTMADRARNQMEPTFSVTWTLVGLLFILLGAAVRLDVLEFYMSWEAMYVLFLGGGIVIMSFYVLSIKLSELMSQNRELAMLVSILAHEKETDEENKE